MFSSCRAIARAFLLKQYEPPKKLGGGAKPSPKKAQSYTQKEAKGMQST